MMRVPFIARRVALLLILALGVLPLVGGTVPAMADTAGLMTFSPTSAQAGTTAQATSCSAGNVAPTSLSFSTSGTTYTSVTPSSTPYLSSSGTGYYCYTFSFVVPSLATNTYTVTAYSNGTYLSTGTFYLTSTAGSGTGLSFSPTSAQAGTTAQATNCSLINAVPTSLSFGVSGGTPTSVAPSSTPYAVTGASGYYCYTFSFVVPSLVTNTYAVAAYSNGTYLSTGSFNVGTTTTGGGSLTVTPSSATPGAAITAYACGVTTPVNLSLVLTGSSYTTSIAPTSQTAVTGVSGCYTITFTVPSSVPTGTYTVTLNNNSVAVASGQLVLATNGTLSPNPVTSGAGTTETGTVCGLISGDGLNVQFVSNTSGLVVNSVSLASASLTAQGNTCYSFSFALPQLAAGTYTITLRGTLSNYTLTSQFTVGAASLSANPTTVTAGQATTLQGNTFSPNATVTLSGLGPNVTLTSTAAGAFSTSFTVPAGTARGSYTLKATDTSNITASVTLSVVPATVSVTVSATSAPAGQQVTVTGSGYAANEQVVVSLSPTVSQPYVLGGTSQTFQTDANGNFSGAYTVPSVGSGAYILLAQGQTSHAQAIGTFTVAASAAPTATATPVTVIPTATPVPSLPLPTVSTASTTTYFADGYTGTAASNGKATFSERIYLFNPSSTASTVTTTYAVYNATANTRTSVVEQNVVPPASTVVRDVNADVGNDRQVSAKVQATSGIVAEEVISRVSATGAVLDSSASRGASQPGTTWYFAEGYTGISLQEYLILYNPGATAAHAQIQYLPSDGTAVAPQAVTVPAGGQVTINVRAQYNGLVKHGSRNIGAQVTSDQPIVVDRAMYWGAGAGSGKFGSDTEPGIASGSQTQYFAYLPTSGGSQAFVTVLNPGTAATGVTLRLLDRTGGTLRSVTAQIPAKQRYTFVVPSILAGSFGPVVGGLVSSSAPVVAEAGDYFGGSPNIGSHAGLVVQGSAGVQMGARAVISTSGAALQVYNPTGAPIRVQVSLGGSGGLSVVFDSTLAAGTTRLVNLPPGSSARSVLVLGSGAFSAAVVSGVGSVQVWGGTLG